MGSGISARRTSQLPIPGTPVKFLGAQPASVDHFGADVSVQFPVGPLSIQASPSSVESKPPSNIPSVDASAPVACVCSNVRPSNDVNVLALTPLRVPVFGLLGLPEAPHPVTESTLTFLNSTSDTRSKRGASLVPIFV